MLSRCRQVVGRAVAVGELGAPELSSSELLCWGGEDGGGQQSLSILTRGVGECESWTSRGKESSLHSIFCF
jgi:hypothetical protein